MARKSLHLTAPLKTRRLSVILGFKQQFTVCEGMLFLLASLSEPGLLRSWLLFATAFSLSDLALAPLPCKFAQAAFGSVSLEFACPPRADLAMVLLKLRSGGGTGIPDGAVDPLLIPAWRAGIGRRRCGGCCWQQMRAVLPALLFLLRVS